MRSAIVAGLHHLQGILSFSSLFSFSLYMCIFAIGMEYTSNDS